MSSGSPTSLFEIKTNIELDIEEEKPQCQEEQCKPVTSCEVECCKPEPVCCNFYCYWAIAFFALIVLLVINYFGNRCDNYKWFNRHVKDDCGWIAYGETMNLWWSIFVIGIAYAAIRLFGGSCGQKRTVNIVMFVVIGILAAIWSYTVFENRSQQAGFGLAIVLILLSLVWLWYSWKTDMCAGVIIILFIIWLIYVAAVNYNLTDGDHHHHH